MTTHGPINGVKVSRALRVLFDCSCLKLFLSHPNPPCPWAPPDISFLSSLPISSLIASNLTYRCSLTLAIDDPQKVVKVIASDGKSGEQRDLTYTNCKVVGNGSFGVVFQAKLVGSPKDGDDIAIKKVLQDKRFKVCFSDLSRQSPPLELRFLYLDRIANCR